MDNQVVISSCPPEFLIAHKLPQSETLWQITFSEYSQFMDNNFNLKVYNNLSTVSGRSKLTCWKVRMQNHYFEHLSLT